MEEVNTWRIIARTDVQRCASIGCPEGLIVTPPSPPGRSRWAASGIDEAAPQGETSAQAAPAASAAEAQAPAPVALPSTETAEAAVETRADDADADRSEARTSPVSDDAEAEEEASEDAEAEDETAEGTGIEVSVPEPVEEAEVADPVGHDGYLRPVSGPITSGYGGRMHPVLGYFKGHDGVDFGA